MFPNQNDIAKAGGERCEVCNLMVDVTRQVCCNCAAGVPAMDGTIDFLTSIYNRHIDYRKMVIDAHLGKDGWAKFNADMPVDQRIFLMTTAMLHETIELQKLTNWKWFKTAKEFDTKEAKEELIDIFHFVMNCFIELGMTPQDIYAEYFRKNDINIERQVKKY